MAQMFKRFHRWLYRGAVRQEFKSQHWDLTVIESLVSFDQMERILDVIYEDYGHSKALSAAYLAKKLDDKYPGIVRNPDLVRDSALLRDKG